MRAASGADATCEQPLADDFLRIVSISDDSGARAKASGSAGDLELSLPAVEGRRRLTIELASPIGDAQLLELDLVKRRVAPSQVDGSTAAQAP